MPKLPWASSSASVEPDRKYLVMASFLPLKHFSTTVRFMRHVQAIRRQLRGTEGLIGYSLWAKPMSRRYWLSRCGRARRRSIDSWGPSRTPTS